MSQERALYWISVNVLIGLGLVVGQVAAVTVAAMVGTSMELLRAEQNMT